MDKLNIRVNGEFKQLPVSSLNNDLNFISDSNYIHTDNNYTDEDKVKLNAIEENANNYVLPNDVVQDSNYVHTDNNFTDKDKEKLDNLKNMNTSLIKELGEVDLADYDDDVYVFIDTLTEEGIYKFVDNCDYFTWVVEVWRLGEYNIGQKFFYEEEGYTYQYYRNGYYNEDDDTYNWYDWSLYLTYDSASYLFAPKSHVHYSSISTSLDIRKYLDTHSNYVIKDLRITSTTNKHTYITRVDYVSYALNGVTKNVRLQEYYDIEEPNKVYKRTGTYASGMTNNVTWGDWYVFEGVSE